MTVIAKTISREFFSASEVETLGQLALFCGTGLLVSLLLLTCGVDLGPGLF